jgi:hypothetical protein
MERPLAPAPALPDGFLGGSAPNLQSLELNFIPFPALPKLLLTATQLANLSIQNIPHSGYISPEVMVTSLAVLVNLKSLVIGFESPESSPNPDIHRRHHAPFFPLSLNLCSAGPANTFMRRVTGSKAPNEARMDFRHSEIWVRFLSQTESIRKANNLNISCRGLELQLSSLAQLSTSFFPPHLHGGSPLHLLDALGTTTARRHGELAMA